MPTIATIHHPMTFDKQEYLRVAGTKLKKMQC